MLSVNNIEILYGHSVLAVTGVSMSVEEGNIVALLGGNGAGKSSTLKAISGVLESEEGMIRQGSIEFDGKRIDGLAPEDVAQLGICHVLEGHLVFRQLTVEDNLLTGAYLRRDRERVAKDMERVYSYLPALVPLRNRQGGYLSGGEQQMLVIGRALMAQPKLILLDEPSLGLAPLLVKEVFGILRRLNREEGIAMVIAEQNAVAAMTVADHGYVIENGRVVLQGPAESLRDNEHIRKHYLGLGTASTVESYRDAKSVFARKRLWGG